jgi:hypothetical protein
VCVFVRVFVCTRSTLAPRVSGHPEIAEPVPPVMVPLFTENNQPRAVSDVMLNDIEAPKKKPPLLLNVRS